MVRTKADGCTKAAGGKAPSKQVGRSATSSSSSDKGGSSNSNGAYNCGGNQLKMWPTPEWQKSVDSFFPKINTNSQNNNPSTATSTSVKPQTSTTESTASCSASLEQPGVSTKELEIESQ